MYFEKFILGHTCRNPLYKCIFSSLVSSWHYPKKLNQDFITFLLQRMTSPMAKHVWIASAVQSKNQESLWKDASSVLTPFSQFPQMETLFLKSTDVDVQRQLDTYWPLLGPYIFEIELSNWIAGNLLFIVQTYKVLLSNHYSFHCRDITSFFSSGL